MPVVRLPTLGGAAQAARDAGAVQPLDARHEPRVPIVAVVPAMRGASGAALELARVLASALGEAGVRAEVTSWAGEGAPESGDEVDAALAALAGGDVRIAVVVGARAAAIAKTVITIAITSGLPPSTWDASARAIRDRIDLELSEPRPGVALGLATALARR